MKRFTSILLGAMSVCTLSLSAQNLDRENLPAPASRETAYGASRQQAGKEAHPRAASLNQVGADVSSTLRCRFANREN